MIAYKIAIQLQLQFWQFTTTCLSLREHRTVHLDKRWSLSWCGYLNLCHCCIYLEFERSHVKDLVCRHEEYRWIRMDMYRQDRSCVIYIWRWDRRRRVWHKDRNRSLNPHLELLKPKQREQTVSLELHQRRRNHQNLDGVWFAGTLVRTEIVKITNWNYYCFLFECNFILEFKTCNYWCWH